MQCSAVMSKELNRSDAPSGSARCHERGGRGEADFAADGAGRTLQGSRAVSSHLGRSLSGGVVHHVATNWLPGPTCS